MDKKGKTSTKLKGKEGKAKQGQRKIHKVPRHTKHKKMKTAEHRKWCYFKIWYHVSMFLRVERQ